MLFPRQLADFRRADVRRQAPADLRDGAVWMPPDPRRGKKSLDGEGRLVPAVLGKIWVVDGWMWTEISRKASAFHTHTHTAEILAFRAELQPSSFSASSFFFQQLGSRITLLDTVNSL